MGGFLQVEPCGHPLVECLPSEMSMTATEDMFCTAPELLEPLTSIHDKGPKAGYSCIAEEDVPLCPAFPVDRPARLKISRSARLAEAQQYSSGTVPSPCTAWALAVTRDFCMCRMCIAVGRATCIGTRLGVQGASGTSLDHLPG